MIWFFMTYGLVFAVPAAWCSYRYLKPAARERPWSPWLRGVGATTLWSLPAALVQTVAPDHGASLLESLPVLPFAWGVLQGGGVVQAIFEETAKDFSGHRQSTMVDNLHYYVMLTVAWTLLFAALAAWRLRGGKKPRDAGVLVLAIGVISLLNSFAGLSWPWWGT